MPGPPLNEPGVFTVKEVHAEFAKHECVVMTQLPPVRERFEGELRLLLKSPHRKEPDRKIIREYFGE